jgi:hypothetical protein
VCPWTAVIHRRLGSVVCERVSTSPGTRLLPSFRGPPTILDRHTIPHRYRCHTDTSLSRLLRGSTDRTARKPGQDKNTWDGTGHKGMGYKGWVDGKKEQGQGWIDGWMGGTNGSHCACAGGTSTSVIWEGWDMKWDMTTTWDGISLLSASSLYEMFCILLFFSFFPSAAFSFRALFSDCSPAARRLSINYHGRRRPWWGGEYGNALRSSYLGWLVLCFLLGGATCLGVEVACVPALDAVRPRFGRDSVYVIWGLSGCA